MPGKRLGCAMYRVAILIVVIALGIAIERVLIADSGINAEKSAPVKGDREKIDVKAPAALQDRQDIKPAAAKADRGQTAKTNGESAKQPPAKADREVASAPAVKPPEEKPPAAKAGGDGKKPPVANLPPAPTPPPAAPKREPETAAAVETPPPVKVDHDTKTPPVATVTPSEKPASKPQRETKRRHARPLRHAVKPRRRYADARQNAVRGDDAQVMRARKAWLRALARKYGYSDW
ncbi:MAG TPA: hypothetical protein VFQ80_03520 [Thermomicrobiales bacterium]|nr:hypothetical protein [Thermomicrobiales bacterium]